MQQEREAREEADARRESERARRSGAAGGRRDRRDPRYAASSSRNPQQLPPEDDSYGYATTGPGYVTDRGAPNEYDGYAQVPPITAAAYDPRIAVQPQQDDPTRNSSPYSARPATYGGRSSTYSEIPEDDTRPTSISSNPQDPYYATQDQGQPVYSSQEYGYAHPQDRRFQAQPTRSQYPPQTYSTADPRVQQNPAYGQHDPYWDGYGRQ